MRVCSKAFLALIASLTITMGGCAYYHPILTTDQKSQIKSEDSYAAAHGKAIFSKIREAGTTGALIVIPDLLTAPPIILPGNTPIESLNKMSVDELRQLSNHCQFVYAEDASIEPTRFACSTISQLASQRASLIKDLKDVYAVTVPIIALVQFHDAQLKAIETQITSVTKAFTNNSQAIEKNFTLQKDTMTNSPRLIID